MALNQYFFGRPRLLFPSTSKSKIFAVYSSFRLSCPNQCSLLYVNTESRLLSFNQLRREFVLTRCSFLMLYNHHSITLSLHSKRFLSSCLRFQHFKGAQVSGQRLALGNQRFQDTVTKIDKIVNYIKLSIDKLDFNSSLPSIAGALPRRLLHLKSGSSTSLPRISEHFLFTQNEHPLRRIEFIRTPFLHTAQGYLPEVCMEISTQYHNFSFPYVHLQPL